MKNLVFGFILLLASVVSASNTPEEIAARRLRGTGGMVADRRNQKGCVVAINAQKIADDETLSSAIDRFASEVHIAMKLENGDFDLAAPAIRGEATLFFIDSETLPISLVAPEAKWALVNIRKLKSDKPPFLKARVGKETFRTLCLLLGAGASKYPSCITQCVTKTEDLDEMPDIKMPLEFMARFETYLQGLGIVQYKVASYRFAVHQGWAPQPTNDIQKAIWDKVHSIPDKPLKIKFDPAAQKGKVTK